MGLGSIFLAFGAVVLVISLAAHLADAHRKISGMHMVAAESIVGGAVLVVLGSLLHRRGQNAAGTAGTAR
jgi:hypothetical protein